MPGDRGTGRQSLYLADDRGGEKPQGEAAGAGELPGVREGLGEGVTGCAPPNPTRHREGGTGEEGRRRRRGRQAKGAQDGVLDKGRADILPSRGVQQPGANTDVNVDTFMALERLGNHGNTGGGKSPPPTVPSVKHAGDVAVREWAAPAHGALKEGGREETMAAGDGGGKCGNLTGVQRVWVPP